MVRQLFSRYKVLFLGVSGVRFLFSSSCSLIFKFLVGRGWNSVIFFRWVFQFLKEKQWYIFQNFCIIGLEVKFFCDGYGSFFVGSRVGFIGGFFLDVWVCFRWFGFSRGFFLRRGGFFLVVRNAVSSRVFVFLGYDFVKLEQVFFGFFQVEGFVLSQEGFSFYGRVDIFSDQKVKKNQFKIFCECFIFYF